jgi:hypothetical protein
LSFLRKQESITQYSGFRIKARPELAEALSGVEGAAEQVRNDNWADFT